MIDKGIGIFALLTGIAGLAVVVSKRSNTAKVLDSLFGGYSKAVAAAVSPVTK